MIESDLNVLLLASYRSGTKCKTCPDHNNRETTSLCFYGNAVSAGAAEARSSNQSPKCDRREVSQASTRHQTRYFGAFVCVSVHSDPPGRPPPAAAAVA